MLISILAGPRFIAFLRRKEYGQTIREEGPEHHVTKQGTPIMGGLLVLGAGTAAYLAVARYTVPALTVLFVTLACGAIGFIDDFIKLTHRRSLGLNARWKLLLLGAITVGVGIAARHQHLPTNVYVPGIGHLELSWAWYGLLFLVIAGAANGVNLTDGLDGLAAGTGIIALFTYAAINVIAWIRSGPPGHRFETKLDLAIVGAALIGGLIGFLWYNAFPAEVFMGDTGSMAIGGALAAFAIMTKTIFLLLLIGGIFAIEALSVILQVFSFRYWGRRIFLMTPIHHHFEMKAWSETKIGVRVWSEIELASRLLPNPILGVTGTNGKTTTAEWLGFMLGAPVAGNVGRALSELDGELDPEQLVVVELSSFQLEDVHEFRPRIAVLLNLEPDHLDRHGSFEAYRAAKLRIFENQTATDTAVVPRGLGLEVRARRVEFAADDQLPAEPSLRGMHNRENAAAVVVAARAAGADEEQIARGLRDFKGVPHRLELVAERGGGGHVKDPKGTKAAAALGGPPASEGEPLRPILRGFGESA